MSSEGRGERDEGRGKAKIERKGFVFTLHPSLIYGQRPVSPCGAPFTAAIYILS